MADNPIKHSDIIQDGNPFEDTIKGLEKLLKLLKETAKEYKKFAEKQNASTKEGRKNLQSAATATQQLSAKEREAIKIKKQLEREQAKLNLMSSKEYKELIRTKEAATAKNRELRNAAKAMRTGVKSTNKWGKALGSFAFKFNALGNIAANVFKRVTAGFATFIKESTRAAAAVEGVRRAFNEINQPGLLKELRAATRGTVSDLKLMTAAVKAKNFKLPLEQLPKYFQAASMRAIETGESVDYLVESIVLGVARKSIPILDNLGISATELREEVKKTGDVATAVGNIMERDLGKTERPLATTAELYAKAGASAENVKMQVGRIGNLFAVKLLPLSQRFLDDMQETLKTTEMIQREVLDANIAYQLEQDRAEVAELALSYQEKGIKLIGDQTYEQKAALSLLEQYKSVLQSVDQSDVKRIELLNNQVKELEKMAGVQSVDLSSGVENLNILREELNLLQKQRDDASLSEVGAINREIKAIEKKIQKYQEAGEILPEIKKITDDITDADLDLEFDEFGNLELNWIRQTNEEKLREEKKYLTERAKAKDKAIKEEIDELARAEKEKQQKIDDTFAFANQLTTTFTNIFAAQKEKELSAVGDNAEKRAEIEKKYAKKEQALAVSQAVVDGAAAIVKTWRNMGGFPTALPFVIAQAAATAAQIGVITAQKFEEGGPVIGQSHSRGGVPIEAEGGEYVINKRSTAKYTDLIQAINAGDQASIANAAMQNAAFHDVWDRTGAKEIAVVSNNDPYIKKLYELMRNTPQVGPYKDRIEIYPNGKRRIING